MGDKANETIKADEAVSAEPAPEALADEQLDDAAGGLLTYDISGGNASGAGTYPKPKHH